MKANTSGAVESIDIQPNEGEWQYNSFSSESNSSKKSKQEGEIHRVHSHGSENLLIVMGYAESPIYMRRPYLNA